MSAASFTPSIRRSVLLAVVVASAAAGSARAGSIATYAFNSPDGRAMSNNDARWRDVTSVAPGFTATRWERPGYGPEVTGAYAYSYEDVNNRYLSSHFWIYGGGFEFSLTATTAFTLDSITFDASSNMPTTSTGHTVKIQYSLSPDYSDLVTMGTYNIVAGGFHSYTASANPITAGVPGTYYFRVAVQAASIAAANSYSLSLDNFSLNSAVLSPPGGAAVPLPAPAMGGLALMGTLALGRARRR